MNQGIQNSFALLLVVGFFNSIESKNLPSKSSIKEGIIYEECNFTKTGYILIDGCGSYCRCDTDKTLQYCNEKDCEPDQEIYTPVENFEVNYEPYAGETIESCEPDQEIYDGCNWCSCGPDGKPSYCTLRLCWRAVYRRKH